MNEEDRKYLTTIKPIDEQLVCIGKCLKDLENGEKPEIVHYAIKCIMGVEDA